MTIFMRLLLRYITDLTGVCCKSLVTHITPVRTNIWRHLVVINTTPNVFTSLPTAEAASHAL